MKIGPKRYFSFPLLSRLVRFQRSFSGPNYSLLQTLKLFRMGQPSNGLSKLLGSFPLGQAAEREYPF